MIFLPSIADLDTDDNKKNMEVFKKHLEDGKQVFLFLYMDGCGPCNMAKEGWSKIRQHMNKQYLKDNNILVAQINKDLFNDIKNIGTDPMGFPTLRYITNNGEIIEEYDGGRSADDFAKWIESKQNNKMTGGKKSKKTKRSRRSRISRKTRRIKQSKKSKKSKK